MESLHSTRDFVASLCATNRLAHVLGMRAVAALDGNPFGMEVAEFDGAFALRSRGVPVVDQYNRVYELAERHLERLSEIVSYHRSCSIVGRIEVTPAHESGPLLQALCAAGYAPEYTKPVLCADARREAAGVRSNPDVEIIPAREEHLDVFLDVWADGFGIPAFLHESVKEIRRQWFCVEGFQRFLAFHRGKPAGAAGLFVDGDIGYLCFAATRPEFRGNGIQSQLIERRWDAARAAGCRWVITETDFDTQSQHNMERAGMQIAFMKSSWVDCHSAPAAS